MRSTRACMLLVLMLVACSGDVLGCRACGGGGIAELIEAQGTVERDVAASVGQWNAAEVGASLQAGDGLRTGTSSTAMLRVGRKGRVHVESETTIRLSHSAGATPTPEAPPALAIERGEARIEAGEEALSLQTDLGQAVVLRAGGTMTLARAEQGTRYRVLVGSASVEAEDGSSRPVAQGQSIVIGLSLAVIEPIAPTPSAAAADAARASAQREALVGKDAAVAEGAAGDAASLVTAIIQGQVRRRGAEEDTWAPMAQGRTQVGADDELEVGEGEASLERGEERAVLSRGRYEVGAADAPLVRAIDGNVRIEAGAGRNVRISVPGGTITALAVDGGTRAMVAVRGAEGRTDVRVERGQVTTAGAGAPLALSEGQRGELLATDEARDAKDDGARAQVSEPAVAAEHAEIVVPAGEFFRIYDPKPPTVIGFKIAKYCGDREGELRVEGSAPVRDREQVNVAVGPGMHDYALHCVEQGQASAKAAIRSKLRIVRNDGARKLPTAPPENDVPLDGRRYTLMYQNLKPVLNAKWPGAPASSGYVLHVTPPGGATLSLRAGKAEYVVKPGVLKDGTNRLQFEASGKTKATSKETLVDIVFDNAAPTASLELPPATGFARGKSVTVAGVVVEDSRVSVAGTPLKVDAQQRFRGEVPLRGDERAIAVRVQHARHGIRYYLRRVSR